MARRLSRLFELRLHMRRLPKRPELPVAQRKKLRNETAAITAHAGPRAEAARRYGNARKAKWFAPVVKSLAELSGPGQRCMFCSGSEATDIEHYRPIAVFPALAMTWLNYLWSCTPCNRGKSNRFPPDTETGAQFLNPLDDDVWEYFFIDEFGILTPRFDQFSNTFNPRAVSTRDFLDLNREAVQESRKLRLDDLKSQVGETLQLASLGKFTKVQLRAKISKWLKQPFQPDVADYFLNGPGREEAPFRELFLMMQ